MSQTRIILVDDHTLFRKGLAELLEQSGTIEVTAFPIVPPSGEVLGAVAMFWERERA